MTAAAILALLEGVLTTAPALLALFQKASSGTPVAASEVNSVLAQYDAARAGLVAAINDSPSGS